MGANDWDLTNGGQCEESEEAWVLTDARDHSMGKCVKFAADSKCAPQCFHQGKAVDETANRHPEWTVATCVWVLMHKRSLLKSWMLKRRHKSMTRIKNNQMTRKFACGRV